MFTDTPFYCRFNIIVVTIEDRSRDCAYEYDCPNSVSYTSYSHSPVCRIYFII